MNFLNRIKSFLLKVKARTAFTRIFW